MNKKEVCMENPLINIINKFLIKNQNGIYKVDTYPGAGKTYAMEQAIIKTVSSNKNKAVFFSTYLTFLRDETYEKILKGLAKKDRVVLNLKGTEDSFKDVVLA